MGKKLLVLFFFFFNKKEQNNLRQCYKCSSALIEADIDALSVIVLALVLLSLCVPLAQKSTKPCSNILVSILVYWPSKIQVTLTVNERMWRKTGIAVGLVQYPAFDISHECCLPGRADTRIKSFSNTVSPSFHIYANTSLLVLVTLKAIAVSQDNSLCSPDSVSDSIWF